MENKKDCKVASCCRSHACTIIGAILLLLGIFLTFQTLNGMGIFGLFIVGLVFCCHKHISCGSGKCGCGCSCCSNTKGGDCSTSDKDCITPVKSKKKE